MLEQSLHRPVGIGVQGLADAFVLMDVPYHSDKAKEINKDIFETIYHGALERSNEISMSRLYDMKSLDPNNIFANDLPHCRQYVRPWQRREVAAKRDAALKKLLPIPSEFQKLKGDHLGAYSSFEGSPASEGKLQFDMWGTQPSNRYDWNGLKERIKKFGLRNSLLVAPMPTASTSQILGKQ